ncbi:hypothetical protein M408DRAFT_328921 [Serendipita vermifera MAFF 305830]|uniref:Uncharacterized protein n=1 Tax=Serendipita vermifera MAFF 305830 TaxID=933852 RepID=A0A0C3BAW4_SERVB|nr:hypothetical protein M408DRAFT_328921 [Serendipita vermifera MAFF 305830]
MADGVDYVLARKLLQDGNVATGLLLQRSWVHNRYSCFEAGKPVFQSDIPGCHTIRGV